MVELIRRVILAAGLLAGIWLMAAVPQALYAVRPIDWNAERGRLRSHADDAKRLLGSQVPVDKTEGLDLAPETRGSLESMIAERTKGRLTVVSGKEWEGFYSGVAATAGGHPPGEGWSHRRGKGYSEEDLYFRLDEKPLSELSGNLNEGNSFRYVEVRGASRSEYLGVTRLTGGDLTGRAPGHLAHPSRFAGCLALLAAVLLYALIPWPKIPRESVRHSRVNGSTLPDLMACVLVGMFFVLPVLIIQSNGGSGPFDEGWTILTIVFWAFALAFASFWPISAWYTGLSLSKAPEALRYKTLREDTTIPLDQIERIEVAILPPPRFTTALKWIAFFVSWRAWGALMIHMQPRPVYRFRLNTGRQIDFEFKGLIGMPQMIGKLKGAGVPVDESVYDALNAQPESKVFQEPFPALGGGIGAAIALIVFAAPLAWLAMLYVPPASPAVTPGALPARAYEKPKSTTFVPSPELMREEERIMAEIAKIRNRMNELTKKLETGNESERREAARESEECLDRITRLQAEFDQARKREGAED